MNFLKDAGMALLGGWIIGVAFGFLKLPAEAPGWVLAGLSELQRHYNRQMPAFMAASAIHNGVLEEVLQSYRPDETSVWIAYLDRCFVSSRIRVFVDFMSSYGKTLRSFF